MTNRKNTT